MNGNWNNYNTADDQAEYKIIPKGTLVKVSLEIKPGGYDDESIGWTGGWATRKEETGTVYLNCAFTIVFGEYAKRKVFSLIGLYTQKGEAWGQGGRSFVKGILNSAHGLSCKDDSPAAQQARQIDGFGDLNGLVFAARIDIEIQKDETLKNVIKLAITPDHKDYVACMSETAPALPSSANDSTPLTGTADEPPPWEI